MEFHLYRPAIRFRDSYIGTTHPPLQSQDLYATFVGCDAQIIGYDY